MAEPDTVGLRELGVRLKAHRMMYSRDGQGTWRMEGRYRAGEDAHGAPEILLPFGAGTLAEWEERLSGCGFLRVHRNALVRLEAVRELSDVEEVVLPAGRIPVSRRRLEELRKALGMP